MDFETLKAKFPQYKVIFDDLETAGHAMQKRYIQGTSKDDSPMLCHYTNFDCLKSILEGGLMYATDAIYLNDSSELVYSMNLVDEIVHTQSYSDGFKAIIDRTLKENLQVAVFCLSFSERPDNLSQWRSYADSGKGVALGFDGDSLAIDLYKAIPDGVLGRVMYEKQFTHTFWAQAVDDLNGIFLKHKLDKLGNDRDLFLPQFSGILGSLFPLFKNHGFSDEQEVRYIVNRSSHVEDLKDVKVRTRSGLLIPYLEIAVPRMEVNLKEIILGPGSSAALSSKALKILLRNLNLGNVAVRFSEIPYRV